MTTHKRVNEAVNAEYTLSGDVFRMDAKEEPTGKYLRRAPAKLYGVFSRRMLGNRICQTMSIGRVEIKQRTTNGRV